MPEVKQVLAAGETKSSVRAATDSGVLIQIDLRIVEPAQFGAALLYFTGSKEHNVRLRERAQKKGLTLNEYGLFKDDGEPAPQHRGKKPIASKTEEDIYDALDAPTPPPELREDQGELSHQTGHDFGLITLDDIKAELHAHTTASTDRSPLSNSRPRPNARVPHHRRHRPQQEPAGRRRPRPQTPPRASEAIRARDEVDGVSILAGSEVDIMPDGSLDYSDDLLEKLDVVVASPHWSLSQKPDEATRRLLKAIEHPLVHIIGHPTGRLINRREGLSPNFGELFAAAAEHQTAMEINSHWLRLDLRDSQARAALGAGLKIAIDCDVHAITDFDHFRFGVLTRRAGVTPKDCLNAWTKKKLHDWLKRKRG